jgi:hypothetical protein
MLGLAARYEGNLAMAVVYEVLECLANSTRIVGDNGRPGIPIPGKDHWKTT